MELTNQATKLGRRNMLVSVKSSTKADPLELTWATQWELNSLIATLANKLRLHNNVIEMQMLNAKSTNELPDVDIIKASTDAIAGIGYLIRDLSVWPFTENQPLVMKHAHTYYTFTAAPHQGDN